MIYKKIAKRAKESGRLGVASAEVDGEVHQWIFAGNGFYDCTELPEMTFTQVCAMFDFPIKVRDELVDFDSEVASFLESADEALEAEQYCDITSMRTYLGDVEMKLLIAADDPIAEDEPPVFAIIPVNDLSPITETPYTRFVLAKDECGQVYVVVYEGVSLIAVIRSYTPSSVDIEIWRGNNSVIEKCLSSAERSSNAE